MPPFKQPGNKGADIWAAISVPVRLQCHHDWHLLLMVPEDSDTLQILHGSCSTGQLPFPATQACLPLCQSPKTQQKGLLQYSARDTSPRGTEAARSRAACSSERGEGHGRNCWAQGSCAAQPLHDLAGSGPLVGVRFRAFQEQVGSDGGRHSGQLQRGPVRGRCATLPTGAARLAPCWCQLCYSSAGRACSMPC